MSSQESSGVKPTSSHGRLRYAAAFRVVDPGLSRCKQALLAQLVEPSTAPPELGHGVHAQAEVFQRCSAQRLRPDRKRCQKVEDFVSLSRQRSSSLGRNAGFGHQFGGATQMCVKPRFRRTFGIAPPLWTGVAASGDVEEGGVHLGGLH